MAKFTIKEKGSFDMSSKKVVGSLRNLTEKQAEELVGKGEPQVERGMTYCHHWKNFNPALNRPCTSARACLLTYVKYKLGLDTQNENLYVIML